jgi:hypothetical protein
MQAMWRTESDDSDIKASGSESRDELELKLTLMTQVEEGPSPINVDKIIVSKNITDSSIIELFRKITLSKNKELESKQQESASTSSNNTKRGISKSFL